MNHHLSQIFSDITPIPQDDGPHPVCVIDYEEEFVQSMNYMRAILQQNELSERALQLSAQCLRHNPANYTLWHFRRQCLSALASSSSSISSTSGMKVETRERLSTTDDVQHYDSNQIREELQFASLLGGAKPKNYQIWYHRRKLLQCAFQLTTCPLKNVHEGQPQTQEIPSSCDDTATSTTKVEHLNRIALDWASRELQYVTQVLKEDAKNYHAWSHRQWILQTMDHGDLWEEEMNYIHEMISEDCFNNSAWNQRWFVCHLGRNHIPLTMEQAQEEVEYTLEIAAMEPNNESPWRYLVAILKEQVTQSQEEKQGINHDHGRSLLLDCEEKILDMKSVLLDSGFELESFVHMTSALIDILEMKLLTSKGEIIDSTCDQAANLAHVLGTVHDTIRRKYWFMREHSLRSKKKSTAL